jgi:Chaperone of endosialidase
MNTSINVLFRGIFSPSTFTLSAIACIALLQKAQAVVPAPDGGYPGGNTAEGQNALFSLTTGGYNTAVGYLSLRSDTTGSFNTALGAGTLFANTGDSNTATGAGALLSNISGANNTANGAFALVRNTTGFFNTAIGPHALENNTTGAANTALGVGAGGNVTTASNVICIGAGFRGENVSNRCYIDQIRGVTTGNPDAIPVLIDSAGQLGTASSSRRYKKEIEPMDNASEVILALKPVTFHYKSDKTNRPEFGLIAEDVAEVNPDLVVRDKNGEIYTVRYDAVNAMLLNEFLKEHRKVAKLEAALEAVNARLRKQETQLQKVTAEVETTKAVPHFASRD